MDVATREKRRDLSFHDGLPKAPDRQGRRSQEAKTRRKEGDPATERSGKGQPHGLGNTSRSCPCCMPKSGTPLHQPVSKPWGRKEGLEMPIFNQGVKVVEVQWWDQDGELRAGKAYHVECALKVDLPEDAYWETYNTMQLQGRLFKCDSCQHGLESSE